MKAVLAVALLSAVPAVAADVQHGGDLYARHCAGCHGSGGRPVLPGAPDFSRPTALLKPDLALAAAVRDGKGAMPGYAGRLREREILDIVGYLRTFR